ncbi:cell wall hydrolase [Stappia indica]|uniref:cell wall hydrolase n=1 Tax=Stappia indica TaxID=538381 RepID=UPI001CD47720|nr:cell wall hydrolase [Stappia indica]MCA1297832.1 cell wall hydrolase [Stappia indica]
MFGTVQSASPRSRRRGRAIGVLATSAPAFYLLATLPVAQQDIAALMEANRANAPRWMSAIEAAPHASSLAPTLVLADASRPRQADAPDYAVTNAMPGSDPAVVRGLESYVKEVAPGVLSDKTRVNRATKGDRYVSMAPDRQMVGVAAGAVYQMASLIGENRAVQNPRVAFIKSAPTTGTALAATQTGRSPLDLTRLAIARNVAATSVSLASAYAPEGTENIRAPFEALLGGSTLPLSAEEEAALEANSDSDPFWWAKRPLPASVLAAKEQRCLAEAVYFEARGEPLNGQVAVAQVVLNRVKNPTYPPTICKVVYQNRTKRNRCQFSFACDGIRDRINDRERWKVAQKVARETVSGQRYLEKVGASTHYHATYVKPRWARYMTRLQKIGQHIFYKTKGGGWS